VHRPLQSTEFYLGVYSLAPSLCSNSIISLFLLFFAQRNGGQSLSSSAFTSAPFCPKSLSFSYVLCRPVLNVKFITCHYQKRLQRLPVICHENKISRDSLRYNPQVIFLDSELKRRDGINELFGPEPFLLFLCRPIFLKQPCTYSAVVARYMLINEEFLGTNLVDELSEWSFQRMFLVCLRLVALFEFSPGHG